MRLATLERIRREYHAWKYDTEPRLQRVLQLLNANEVRYLVAGGYAVALHGYPRYTRDLDIWIEISKNNARKLVAARDEFGYASPELEAKELLEPGTIVQLGYPPNRIDILTSLAGVDLAACFETRVPVYVDDIEINFIDLDNLKKNKSAAGRPQDLADLDNLQ